MASPINFPYAEQILAQYKSVIASDFTGYKHHVLRMLSFCHALKPDMTEEQSHKLQIAAAFHDIALWTHDRVDYLVPSYQVALEYLAEHGLEEWQQEIQIIIDVHHLTSEYQGPFEQLAEVFRKADLIDFSLGLIRNGLSRTKIKEVKQALPNAGFHLCLLRFSLKQLFRNPLRPAPMIRVKNPYN